MGLTYLRLLLLPVFLWLLLLDARSGGELRDVHRRLALGVFALMAITDKLDGYLARRLNQTSRLGALLDPVADKLLLSITVVLLWFEWCAPPGYALPTWFVATVYGKDALVVFGILVLLAAKGRVSIKPRWTGKIACALQMITIVATLAAPDLAIVMGSERAYWFTRGLWAVTGASTALAIVDYLALGIRQLDHSSLASTP
jgi:cardiolipin synthase